MTKISDKSADNQSEARISVAYNKNFHLAMMTIFVKHPPVFFFLPHMGERQLCLWELAYTPSVASSEINTV